MKKTKKVIWTLFTSCLVLCALVGFTGCTTLKPGADAVVVRAEQTETMARATFETFLKVDHADRDFWREHGEAAHEFAEWLRTAQVPGDPSSRRWIVMVSNLDEVKRNYIKRRATSNDVVLAIGVVASAVRKAEDFIAAESAR